jgi:endo-1,4-beta-xylanase
MGICMFPRSATALAGIIALLSLSLPVRAQAPALALRELAAKRGLTRFGTCASVGLLRSGADAGLYPAYIAREFSVVEAENELKPPAIWRGPTDYNWANADYLLGAPGATGWAQRNRVAVRGHVLVYARDDGYTLPGWLAKSEADISPADARKMLHDYIFAVAGRYRGKIFAWDVVNEAIDDKKNDRPFNLRDSFWFRKLGPDFLKLAFQWAHEADPRAELYLNEYGAEGMGRKSDAVLAILTYLRSAGVYVTGAGMQYHIGLETTVTPGDAHYLNAQRLSAAGFAFAITELDIGIPVSDPGIGYVPAKPEDLDRQAELYRAVLHFALASKNCRLFQLWGPSDNHSWIPGFSKGSGAATPSDAKYQPKPAYRALQSELSAGRSR